MATTQTKAKADNRALSATLAKQRGALEYVDESKYFTCLLQLGARKSWRSYSGGAWLRDPEGDDDRNPKNVKRAYRHVPALHQVGPLSGKILNGLIQSNNDWVEANEQNRLPAGDVSRQMLVSDIKETTEPPEDQRVDRMNYQAIREIAKGVAEGFAASLTAAKPTK